MSLDSAAARYSVAGVNGPWNVGVFPDATLPGIWRQAAGWGYAGFTTASPTAPEDDDSDQAFTVRLDLDGNTIRPPRQWALHVADSLRLSDLTYERVDADRRMTFSERFGRGEQLGRVHRIGMVSARAGEVDAFNVIMVDADVVAGGMAWDTQKLGAQDATARLDVDGNSVIPVNQTGLHAADSVRLADLSYLQSEQDRYGADFEAGLDDTGQRHMIGQVDDGAAGGVVAIRYIEVVYHEVDDGQTYLAALRT